MIETPAITEQTMNGGSRYQTLSSRGGAGRSAEKQLLTQRMAASPEKGGLNLGTMKCFIDLAVAPTYDV
jgi:hypothetical protein